MFSEKIINWYTENGRNLPWRGIDNPYFIWLSEIILQQTRIEQGRAYYEHFINTYPTVKHLADASEEQILKSWQGLGYYSRARNLHKAARIIAYNLNGKFPQTHEGILSLPGIGKYTASAIASFALRLPYPVVDGNVYRLIARLYSIYTPIGTEKAYREFEQILLRLIDPQRPDLFNHAIMDFGSIFCKPIGSDCPNCPFSNECLAYRNGTVDQLPVRQPAINKKERYFYYFDIRWNSPEENIVIHKREPGDIWQGLYELPLFEAKGPVKPDMILPMATELLNQWFGSTPASIEIGPTVNHTLTHQTIKASFLIAKYLSTPTQIPKTMCAIQMNKLKKIPISRLIDRYLSKM